MRIKKQKEFTVSRTALIKAALGLKRLHDRWIEHEAMLGDFYATGKPTPEEVKAVKMAFQKAESAFYLLPDKLTPVRRSSATRGRSQ